MKKRFLFGLVFVSIFLIVFSSGLVRSSSCTLNPIITNQAGFCQGGGPYTVEVNGQYHVLYCENIEDEQGCEEDASNFGIPCEWIPSSTMDCERNTDSSSCQSAFPSFYNYYHGGAGEHACISCSCDSCESCTEKLNDSNCSIIMLDTNISSTSGDCINPSVFSHKTFDCQGHTIVGGSNMLYKAINVADSSTASTIKNCIIKNFGVGIYMGNVATMTITNNIVNDSGHGIEMQSTVLSNITNNEVSNLIGTAIILHSSDGCNLFNNILRDNEDGISSTNSDSNNISSNYVCNNNRDFESYDWLSNFGDNNICDNPGTWNDTGTTGCTNDCSNNPPSWVGIGTYSLGVGVTPTNNNSNTNGTDNNTEPPNPTPTDECNNILSCSDYTDLDNCTSDPCGVNSTISGECDSSSSSNNYPRCNWTGSECVSQCVYVNATTNEAYGVCSYKTILDGDCSTSSFISYNLEANWTLLDPSHQVTQPPTCANKEGETITCPSQTKLPLTSFFGIILTIIVISFGYLIFNKNHKKSK